MKKNLLLLAMAMLAIVGLGKAQTPVSNFFEGFEDGTLGVMTTIDADGDGHNWNNSSALEAQGDGHDGSIRYAFSESWAPASSRWGLDPDNYLVSPLVAIDETSVFTFYVCLDWYVYPGEHYGVAISTTGNTDASDFLTIAEWDLNDKGTRDDDQGPWHEHNIDLSQYAGQNIYVAIRHFGCSNVYRIDVDDISVTSEEGGCDAPANLTATASANTINLSWTASPSAGTYSVFRGETMIANNLAGTTYTDSDLNYSTQYCYTVKTNCDNGNISDPSNQACATTADPCTAPNNLQAIANGGNVIVTWNSVSSALSYTLYRDEELIAENLTVTNYIDENVASGHHCYTVASECIEGTSPDSSPACVDIEDLGIEESMNHADIYPNPSSNDFNINCKGMTRVTVYGMRGETIMDINVEADNYVITDLNTGVYFVRIETATGNMTQKIVRL